MLTVRLQELKEEMTYSRASVARQPSTVQLLAVHSAPSFTHSFLQPAMPHDKKLKLFPCCMFEEKA